MKLIENAPITSVSVNGAEYFILLRPSGLISDVCTQHPNETSSMSVLIDRPGLGGIIQVSDSVARLIETASPGHVCDQEFRKLVTQSLLERDPASPAPFSHVLAV